MDKGEEPKARKQEKKSDKKREKNTIERHASIGNLFSLSSLKSPFEIPKVVTSSHLGPFPRMHNFDGIVQ